MSTSIELYDTTLRDGTQMEGISLSVEDKLKIARSLPRRSAQLTAFGSTRHAGSRAESDPNLRALVDAGTRVVTIVGKAHDRHGSHILETTAEENLARIADSVRYLKSQ